MTEELIQLDDLVYSYPDQNESGFQTEFSSKYEFIECAALPNEPMPEKGKYYNAQKLIHRFLLPYKDLLIMWRTGTGKTSSVGGKAEEIKRNRIFNMASDFIGLYNNRTRSNIKKCIILVRGDVLKDDFIRQLYRCANPEDIDSRKKDIRALGDFYEIITYHKFASEALTKTDEELITIYSDVYFIIDEVHNIRIDPTEGLLAEKNKILVKGKYKESKPRRQAITYQTIHRVFHVAKRTIRVLMSATPMINDSWEIMDIMNLILPLDKQMNFSPQEFANKTIEELEPYFRGRISYLRESGIDVVPNYDYPGIRNNDITYEIKKSNGMTEKYISKQKLYPLGMEVARDENDPRTYNMGGIRYARIDENGIQQPVYPQGNIYRQNADSIKEDLNISEEDPYAQRLPGHDIITKGVNIVETGDKKPKHSFYYKERELCNAVFPDGSYGEKGFSKFIQVIDEKNDRYTYTDELYQWIKCPEKEVNANQKDIYIPFKERFDIDKLRYLSAKYSEIVSLVYDSYHDPEVFKGTSYAYTHWFKGSGAVYLGLCLDANGIEKLNISSSVFDGSQIKEPITSQDRELRIPSMCTPVCEDDDRPCQTRTSGRKVNLTKKLRYALLHSGMPPDTFRSIIQLYNSWENRHGDYLKLIIYTPIGKEGFNLSNSVNFYGIDPGWNMSDSYQAMSRGLRAVSHQDLIDELKKEAIQNGKDPEDVRIKVNIYPFIAIDPISKTSIDLKLLQLSENKDIYVKIEERYIKRIAIDEILHENRNQKPTDMAGSAVCDYQDCKYDPFDPKPQFIDYSSYDILYNEEALELIIAVIKRIFKTNFKIHMDDLIQHFENIKNNETDKNLKIKYTHFYRKKLILFAIDKIIGDKIFMYNKYGFRCYLLEDNSILFTQTEYPVYNSTGYYKKYNTIYYNENLISIIDDDVSNYLFKLDNIDQSNIIDSLNRIKAGSEQFDTLFENLTSSNKIKIIEEAIYKHYLLSDNSISILKILDKYSKHIYKINEPVHEIQTAAYTIQNINTNGAGRHVVNINKSKKIIMVPEEGSNISPYHTPIYKPGTLGDEVIIHNLYGQLIENTYSATASFKNAKGKIRLLKLKPGEIWRESAQYETPVYHEIIKTKRKDQLIYYEQFPIYGFVLSDGEFRIRSKLTESDKARNDDRYINKGRISDTIKKGILIKIAIALGIQLPVGLSDIYIKNKDYQYMRQQLIRTNIKEASNLNEEEVVFTYKVLIGKYTREQINQLIEKRLYELKRVYIE